MPVTDVRVDDEGIYARSTREVILDVCFDGVHDGDVVSGAGEVCGQRSADGAGAPDEDVVGHGNCNNLPRRRCDAEVKGEKAEGVERSSS